MAFALAFRVLLSETSLRPSLSPWMKRNFPPKAMTAGFSLLAAGLGLALGLGQARAGSATWLPTPNSGDWNTALNWTSGGPPNGAADSANFGFSTVTAISLSANTLVSSIEFFPGASAYTITSSPGVVLSISGVGIINNSGQVQNFITAAGMGETIGNLSFSNFATAGTLTSLTNTGGTSTAGFGGRTSFLDTSNAGGASITNQGGTVFAAQSGYTQFFDDSSAADANFRNGGAAANGAFGGATLFLGNSNAGQAHFVNEGGLVLGAGGGFIQFSDRASAGDGVYTNQVGTVTGAGVGIIQFSGASTAASGTFTNFGATVEGEPGGATVFLDNSSAANGRFSNRGGRNILAHGGAILFFGNSTASDAVIVSHGGEFATADGGETNFFDYSSAGTGTFTNKCAQVAAAAGGFTQFFNSSTAANAFFTNEGGAENNRAFGFMNFFDDSTAGHGTFVTHGGAVFGALGGNMFFQDNSSAGEGTFTTYGAMMPGAAGGTLYFDGNASAANGTFTTHGGMGLGAPGAQMSFFGSSTAGNGSFTINGGAVDGAFGGRTDFFTNSSAATGTFILNGGAAPGASGGFLKFWDESTAAEAIFVINGGTVPKIVSPAATGNGGTIQFIGNSRAGEGTFINNGGVVSGASGGLITFASNGSLGSSIFVNNGGVVSGAEGALFQYFGRDGGTATLIANGGADGGAGGSIIFFEEADARGARIQVFGNGSFDISPSNGASVRVGSLEGSGLVFLGANDLSVGGNGLDTLFSGSINDGGFRDGTGGSLTKTGPGILTLSGSSSYSGDTAVLNGSLIVNGFIASPNAFVSAAGLLGGSGSIRGNVFNSGFVSPGDSGPGRLSLHGNYAQSSGGTLRIEIGGLAFAQHDLLQLNGTAQLDGTLQIIRLNNFRFLPGDRVTFLAAAAGVSGTFSTVTNPFNDTIVLTRVLYEANQVSLEAVQGSFASLPGLTPNQRAVADSLDAVAAESPGDELIASLNTERLAHLPLAYDLIAPDELASIYETGFSRAQMQSLNLRRRMEQIRAGSTGFSESGFNLRGNGKEHAEGKTLASNASVEKPAPLFASSPENRWGMFITGAGEYIDIDNHDGNAPGYDIETGGVTLGLDFRPAPNFALGVNAGYAHSSADLVNDGRLTVEGGKAGVFATYFTGGFYLDSAVGAGWNTYETQRRSLRNNTQGSTDGAQFEAMIGTGYEWERGAWRFGPAATLQYADVGINAFQEGRSLGALEILEQDASAFRSALEIKVSYDWKASGLIVRPDLRVGWQHEYADRSYPIEARFGSGTGNAFTVRGPAIDRDKAVLGAGLTLQWSSRVATHLYYQGQLGQNHQSHSAGGGVSLSF